MTHNPTICLKLLPRVVGDAVGDEHDQVPARARVADGLAQDAHAEDELVPVQQRDVGLLRRRRRRRPAEQRRRGEGGHEGQGQPGRRRRPHRG
ncbi:Os04g0517350, partial [Oryza sativa Japonica Group]